MGSKRAFGVRDAALPVLIAVLGLGFAALISTVALLALDTPETSQMMAYYGDAFLGVVSALLIIGVAARFDTASAKLTWTGIGVSVLLTAIADSLWELDTLGGTAERVGLLASDIFYALAYLFFALALVRYAFHFADQVDFAWVATEAFVGCTITAAVTWYAVLGPATRASGGFTQHNLAHLGYIAADFTMILAPVVCLIALGARLPQGMYLGPRSAALVGAAVQVAANVAWYWERSRGGTLPGSLAEFGFMSVGVLFAMGAASARAVEVRAQRIAQLQGRD